jgi:hypothetical protein
VNEDFRDLLAELLRVEARFLIVGAHALAVHGFPRATGDLDVWIEREQTNAEKLHDALQRFGAPVGASGISAPDFLRPNVVVQIGLPPRRIDILTDITGGDFAAAWETRVTHELLGLPVPFVGRAELIANKRATGRLRDRADVEALEKG